MKKSLVALFALLTMLLAAPAGAVDTQAVTRAKLGKVLSSRFQGLELQLLLKHMALVKIYATATERASAIPDVGSVGYAVDDASFKWYSSAGWQAVTLSAGGDATVTGVTYANGGVDRSTAAALAIGAANATSVVLTPNTTVTGDLSLGGGAGALTFTGASSSVVTTDNSSTGLVMGASGALSVVTLDTRNGAEGVAVTGYETVSGLLTATGGVKSASPLFVMGGMQFCGNGSNGATAWYDGPITVSQYYAANYSIGGAACDANDSGTEATADAPMDAIVTRKVVGMTCATEAGGTSDTNTFQLRDDTADVTGMTCSVTNDGAAAKTCSVTLSAPVTVVAGSTLAIKNTQSGTDDMSAKDMWCSVSFTY